MRPVVFIPGMWAGSAAGRGFVELIQEGYQGPIHVAAKEKYQKRRTFQDLIDGVRAEFAHLTQPIFLAHSLGCIVALKLMQLGMSRDALLICPGTPGNYPNVNLATLQVFAPPLFKVQPYIPSYDVFRRTMAQDCKEKDVQAFYQTFIPEPATIYRQFFLRHPSTCLHDLEYFRQHTQGEIITCSQDPICPSSFHEELAKGTGFTLHQLESSHSPLMNHCRKELQGILIRYLQKVGDGRAA